MFIDDLKNTLEKIDSYRDKFLFLFIKPYWPRKITPNHITWVRVLIGVILFVVLFFFGKEDGPLIISLFCVGVLTDLIDGPVARGTNRVTEFGAMLDSTADRILIFPIAIYSLYGPHKWLLLILLLVEILNAVSSMFYKSKEIYLESNIFGKTKMVLLCIVFIVILIVWPKAPPALFIYVLWISIIFSCLSIFSRILELNNKGYIKNRIISKQLNKYEEQSKNI
ncbi:MAG: CDP-alcohol phosphatidyltransferase family protein [Candidatus Staskawiczbacteria bacterium]|nr:CDP-alcohol phosphatidyltransferase family protein [Candidatus Staskawiczbacteria bacterium]